MNEFVEECRREWRRLRVPDPIADDMAAELAADLEEAAAEGEDELGSGDPCAFAAAWATERGVIPPPRGDGFRRRFLVPAAIGALALLAIVGAVLVLASPASPERRAFVLPGGEATVIRVDAPEPPSEPRWVAVAAGIAGEPVTFVPAPGKPLRFTGVDSNDSSAGTRTAGAVLLIVGLAGIVLLTLVWSWLGRRGVLSVA